MPKIPTNIIPAREKLRQRIAEVRNDPGYKWDLLEDMKRRCILFAGMPSEEHAYRQYGADLTRCIQRNWPVPEEEEKAVGGLRKDMEIWSRKVSRHSGSFYVKSGVLRVTDPCYEIDIHCAGIVRAKVGKWHWSSGCCGHPCQCTETSLHRSQ